jgi:hypothetical protein
MLSVSQSVLATAVERRQEEAAKDEALKVVHKALDKEGWLSAIDPAELDAAIRKAELVGCHPSQLAAPAKRLRELTQGSFVMSFLGCGGIGCARSRR